MPDSNTGSDSDRSSAQAEAVFGIKAARGEAPYAILGHRLQGTSRSRQHDDAAETPSETNAETTSEATALSAHSLRLRQDGQDALEQSSAKQRAGNREEGSREEGEDGERKDTGKGVLKVKLPPIDSDLPMEDRPAEAMRLAQEAFSQTGYWVAFYRATLGVDGVVAKLFPEQEQLAAFEETSEFAEIHKMLTALRTADTEKVDVVEPQTMITIRMPRSLRAVLVEEAKLHGVSINKLCISKLLLPISHDFVPEERGKVRGRKPGQQAKSNRGQSSRGRSGG